MSLSTETRPSLGTQAAMKTKINKDKKNMLKKEN